ncbi:hypothetical protein KA977_06370, partial [Candidatus Dependentiae bacterium]|nr:hypothetical protein [Candidatus Dependentiae bacterium]
FGKQVWLSVMSQYSPKFKAFNFPEINRQLKNKEYYEIEELILELDLENVFLQELSSQKIFFPDFSKDIPFAANNKTI